MIMDGKAIAAEVLARAKERASRLPRPPRVHALAVGETPATRSYLSIKEKRAAEAGCDFDVERFSESTTAEELIHAIRTSEADAVLVQLPLPSSMDMKRVLDAIPAVKDADVLSETARAGALLPPVVGAVAEILSQNGVALEGKTAVVIGNGWLVGAPVAAWLASEGARVTVLTKGAPDFREALSGADLVVSGAGAPGIIKPEMIAEGAILIDAGTSESGGEVVGDADPACAEKCTLFTPVPNGVGPIAVAKLFENAVALAEQSS